MSLKIYFFKKIVSLILFYYFLFELMFCFVYLFFFFYLISTKSYIFSSLPFDISFTFLSLFVCSVKLILSFSPKCVLIIMEVFHNNLFIYFNIWSLKGLLFSMHEITVSTLLLFLHSSLVLGAGD